MHEERPVLEPQKAKYEKNQAIEDKLDRWVELSPSIKGARKARQDIVNALKQDLGDTLVFSPLNLAMVKARTKINIAILERRTNKGVNLIRTQHKEDSQVFTEILKFGEEWIAREVREVNEGDPKVISEARIGPNGITKLTLDYDTPEYIEKNANPNFKEETRFPRAALTTFNLLVGYVQSAK